MVLFGPLDFYNFMLVGLKTPQIDIDALKRKSLLEWDPFHFILIKMVVLKIRPRQGLWAVFLL